MTVRFASFNVENLFARPRAYNQTTWAQGQPILNAYAELATKPVDKTSTRMTAQVIHDVAADIQAVVEAQDRPSLDRFNTDLLASRRGRRRGCAEIGRPSRRGGEPCG